MSVIIGDCPVKISPDARPLLVARDNLAAVIRNFGSGDGADALVTAAEAFIEAKVNYMLAEGVVRKLGAR